MKFKPRLAAWQRGEVPRKPIPPGTFLCQTCEKVQPEERRCSNSAYRNTCKTCRTAASALFKKLKRNAART